MNAHLKVNLFQIDNVLHTTTCELYDSEKKISVEIGHLYLMSCTVCMQLIASIKKLTIIILSTISSQLTDLNQFQFQAQNTHIICSKSSNFICKTSMASCIYLKLFFFAYNQILDILHIRFWFSQVLVWWKDNHSYCRQTCCWEKYLGLVHPYQMDYPQPN